MPSLLSPPKPRILSFARSLGFDLVGFAAVAPLPSHHSQGLGAWLDRGYHASMAYMERHREERENPLSRHPWIRTCISVAMSYNPSPEEEERFRGSFVETTARYAWGDDYHEVIGGKLRKLADFLRETFGEEVQTWFATDTAPILEKAWAAQAGLGWMGKHTNLIHPRLGSSFLLGEVFTSLDFEPDTPLPDRCGSCTACIDACPTGAILKPFVLDAGRCISYLTIEHRGTIESQWHRALEGHFFGCDICQEVCPWNRKAPPGTTPEFQPREAYREVRLQDLVEVSEDGFRALFRHSALKRPKLEGARRNAALAVGKGGACFRGVD